MVVGGQEQQDIAEDEQLKARKKKYINKEFCSERSLLFCYGTFNLICF